MTISLPNTVVQEWPDLQQNFDQISADGLAASNNLSDLTDVADALANLGISIPAITTGSGSMVFSASNNEQLTITHGLGVTPTHVSLTINAGGDGGLTVAWDTATSTTFRASILTTNGNITNTIPFTWMAVA